MIVTKVAREEAINVLRSILQPGDALTMVLAHVSRSRKRGSAKVLFGAYNLSWRVSQVLVYDFDEERDAVKLNEISAEVGTEIVSALGRTLFPDGGPAEKSRRFIPSEREPDGGFLLVHRWL